MDIETLKEILSEYFVPVDTINWKQLLVNALPSIVAIITVITSTIVQLRSSKRETDRVLIQMEQQKDLERIRQEEFRKNAILEKQLENQQNIQSQRFKAYSKILEVLYEWNIESDPSGSLLSLRSHVAELLSLCSSQKSLFDAVGDMICLIPQNVTVGTDSTKLLEALRYHAQIIGEQLVPPGFCVSTSNHTEPPVLQ